MQIDEPKFRFSIRQNYLPNVTQLLLHAAARPKRRAVVAPRQERGPLQLPLLGDELREFSDIAGAASELVKKSYLYTNNHFSAKSVVNAVMLKAQLGQPIEGEYPPELVERYPEIASLVATSRSARFLHGCSS